MKGDSIGRVVDFERTACALDETETVRDGRISVDAIGTNRLEHASRQRGWAADADDELLVDEAGAQLKAPLREVGSVASAHSKESRDHKGEGVFVAVDIKCRIEGREQDGDCGVGVCGDVLAHPHEQLVDLDAALAGTE